MNNNYNSIFYIILIFCSINIFSEEKIFFNRNNFKNLCESLNNFKNRKNNLNKLNAYDRAEERLRINDEKKKFLNNYFIIHLNSDEFELGDYNFSHSNFKIKNIKLKSGLELETDNEILLNISKEDAKMIAAKKKLGILDLYLKIKLKNIESSYNDYCNIKSKKLVKLKPKIYEYFFMCAQSNKIIDYELLDKKEDKFISSPFIDLKDKEKIKKINKNLSAIEKRIYYCKNKFKGYGTKIYQIKIDLDGDKILVNKTSSFRNKDLEHCIDKEILKEEFPKINKEYSIYFSIVISNIK